MSSPNYAQLALSALLPLSMTVSSLTVLRKGTDRALVLPTPFMLWLLFMSQRASDAILPAILAYGAALVLLYGCWQQRRKLAQCATIACGAAATWMQLSSLPM